MREVCLVNVWVQYEWLYEYRKSFRIFIVMKKVFLKTKKENCDRSSLDRVEANKLERANSYLLVLVEKRKFVIDE